MTNTIRCFCRYTIAFAALTLAFACGTTSQNGPTPIAVPPTQFVEMEPMRIEATRDGQSVHIEAYDAADLFDKAGIALADKRFDEAQALYDKLLKSFQDSRYVRPSYYNLALAHIGKKNWVLAIESLRSLVEKYPDHLDAKDSLFQMGACYAELGNWPSSAEIFARVLERKDLTADDHIEAMARRAFAQFNLNDLDLAEKNFRAVLAYRQKIESEERLGTDFYLAFSHYHFGQIFHQRFRGVTLRLPEVQMEKDLDEKARFLLSAQRAYIDTIKLGNPAWASAAGFQVGALYEELYEAFMHAPIPPELKGESREVYVEELQKKIRILLEKSLRWQRENLLMIERLGVNTDWVEKSRLAYVKVLKLLDPQSPTWDFKAGPPPIPPASPSVPVPLPRQTEPSLEKKQEPAGQDSVQRSIL
jgi:tetratricopeptide (TPR) repeat protein